MSSSNPATTDTSREHPLGNLLPQPVYQALRNHFLRPHETVHVSRYFFEEWFPRLGLRRWLLVLLLREALSRSNEHGVVRITREELAARIECSEKTISDLLRHIPHPTRKGWRAIDPKGPDGRLDPRRQALSLFIPRLRYWYEKAPHSDAPPKRCGFIIAVSMDDPLTPEDEARMRALSLEEIQSIVVGDTPVGVPPDPESLPSPEGSAGPSGTLPTALRSPSQSVLSSEGTLHPSETSVKGIISRSGAVPEGAVDLSGMPSQRKRTFQEIP